MNWYLLLLPLSFWAFMFGYYLWLFRDSTQFNIPLLGGRFLTYPEEEKLHLKLNDLYSEAYFAFSRSGRLALKSRQLLDRRYRRVLNIKVAVDLARLTGHTIWRDHDEENGDLYVRRNAETTLEGKRQNTTFLIVTCPSTKHTHMIFVPNEMRTAKQARAWTFGMTPEEFNPTSET